MRSACQVPVFPVHWPSPGPPQRIHMALQLSMLLKSLEASRTTASCLMCGVWVSFPFTCMASCLPFKLVVEWRILWSIAVDPTMIHSGRKSRTQGTTQTFLKSWKALSTPYGGWIPMRGLDSASWKKPSMQTRKLSGNFPACNGLADPSMKLKASSTSFPAVVQTRRFTPLQAVPGDGSSCDTCFMGH